jgi:hypothetical protein
VLPFINTVTHRGRRGARLARREEGEYREYLTDEQRREAGWIVGRMPPYLPGRVMARTGLRMMPTSPSPSLKFRTVGFPQYGFKASMSSATCRDTIVVKPTPGVPTTGSRLSSPFARIRGGRVPGSVSRQVHPSACRCARSIAPLPQGSLAPDRVLLSQSLIAYRDPIRPSHGHATISRHSRLYVTPSLCGRASATRGTFPTFATALSSRAVDHTPVGSRGCPVARAPFDSKLPRFHPESPPTRPASASNTRREVQFRRGIVRVMLRPGCLPRPPDWLQRDAITCVAPRLLRTLSPPLWSSPVAGRRWESG